MPRAGDDLAGGADSGGVETDGDAGDFVIDRIVLVDLAAGRATQHHRAGTRRLELHESRAGCERGPRTEIEDEIRFGLPQSGELSAIRQKPRQPLDLHATLPTHPLQAATPTAAWRP